MATTGGCGGWTSGTFSARRWHEDWHPEGMNARIEVEAPTGGMRLEDLRESLDSARDLLDGVDALLAGGASAARGRSARALLSLAADLVAQSADLVRALPR